MAAHSSTSKYVNFVDTCSGSLKTVVVDLENDSQITWKDAVGFFVSNPREVGFLSRKHIATIERLAQELRRETRPGSAALGSAALATPKRAKNVTMDMINPRVCPNAPRPVNRRPVKLWDISRSSTARKLFQ